MNGKSEDSLSNNPFYRIPENDALLDIYFGDRNPSMNFENSQQQKPFDLTLFKSEDPDTHRGRDQYHLLSEQERQLQTKKKMKNTYASKIAKLIHEDVVEVPPVAEPHHGGNTMRAFELQSEEVSRSQHPLDLMKHDLLPESRKEEKLLKNRLSAQKSRKMKKQYMEILEERVKELETELAEVKKENEKYAEQAKKFSYQQSLYRYGATGMERLNLLNYYFKQIFDIMMPDIHKYMLYAADKQVDLFATSDTTETSPFFDLLEFSKKDRQRINNQYRQTLLHERQLLEVNLTNVFRMKETVEKQIKRIEVLYDSIRKEVEPRKLAQALLLLEKNKYKKELSRIWGYWNDLIERQLQGVDDTPVRKHFKK